MIRSIARFFKSLFKDDITYDPVKPDHWPKTDERDAEARAAWRKQIEESGGVNK